MMNNQNNHILTDKVATSRKEKHLVSVLNALECTAQLQMGAEGRSGYIPFSATPVHQPSRGKFSCLSLLSWLRCAELLTWLLTFTHHVYSNYGMTDVCKLFYLYYIQLLLHLFLG